MHKRAFAFTTVAGLLTACLALPAPRARADVFAKIAGAVKSTCESLLSGLPTPIAPQSFDNTDPLSADKIKATFVNVQDFWRRQFQLRGWPFTPASLVVYRGQVQTDCGPMDVGTGPLYCGENQTLYVNPDFLSVVDLGPATDTLREYLVSHEYGHHMQRVRDERFFFGLWERMQEGDPGAAVLLSKMEMQADCVAGVFVGSQIRARGLPGRLAGEMVRLAKTLGNDSHIHADGNTGDYDHGSGADRAKWVQKGLSENRVEACEPFDSPVLNHVRL